MTGRDLIIYILKNGLENEPVFNNDKFIGFITAGEAAAKLEVGVATIFAWISQGRLDGVQIGDVVYIPADFELKTEENRYEGQTFLRKGFGF